MKQNVFFVDGIQTHILNREGVLPLHMTRQLKRAYAIDKSIGQWNYPNTAKGVGLRYVTPEDGLKKWP